MKTFTQSNVVNVVKATMFILAFLLVGATQVRTQTVADIISGSADHTVLSTAVTIAGLGDALQGAGPFTVFAPTDDAFNALPEGFLDELVADPDDLTMVLLYHVVGAKALSTDLEDGQVIETLLGKDIRVTISDEGVFINEAQVTVANLEADNGVVHVIDAVITPPADIVVTEHPELGHILTDKDGRTLYFFTRDADGSSVCAGACVNNWPVFYEELLFIADELEENDFGFITRDDEMEQITYKGWPLYYFINDTEPGQVNGDNVNGVWYVAKPDYSIMLANNQLVGNNGINYRGDYTEGDEVIQYFTDANGVTLYTWVNDRFNTNKFTREDFGNNAAWPIYEADGIVVPSSIDSGDFTFIEIHGRTQLAYRGWPLYYFGQDAGVRGDTKGVSVPQPGIWPVAVSGMASPKFETVVDIIVGSEVHTTLATAVTLAGLVDALSGEGPFTVFAPTNDAFAALPEGLLDALLADPNGALTDILFYHVVAARALSTDLSDGQTVTTLLGEDLTVTITEEGVFINDAQVIIADLEADNGVVHVIDAVLVPAADEGDVLVLNVKMAVWAEQDRFDPENDFVDVAGTFNNWGDTPLVLTAVEGDPDLTYTITIADLTLGEEYAFKFRINGSWDNDFHEFPADGPNRLVTMQEGRNEYIFWFNDEDRTTSVNVPETAILNLYPNPASDVLSISSDSNIREVRLVSMIGQIVHMQKVNSYNLQINVNQFDRGFYLLQVHTDNGVTVERVLISR